LAREGLHGRVISEAAAPFFGGALDEEDDHLGSRVVQLQRFKAKVSATRKSMRMTHPMRMLERLSSHASSSCWAALAKASSISTTAGPVTSARAHLVHGVVGPNLVVALGLDGLGLELGQIVKDGLCDVLGVDENFCAESPVLAV